jgi:hypothetical protein
VHRDTSRIDCGNPGRGNNHTFLVGIFFDVFEERCFTGARFPGQKYMPRRVVHEIGCRTEERVVVHGLDEFTTSPWNLKPLVPYKSSLNTG